MVFKHGKYHHPDLIQLKHTVHSGGRWGTYANNGYGGNGAYVKGTFDLNAGDVLHILIRSEVLEDLDLHQLVIITVVAVVAVLLSLKDQI